VPAPAVVELLRGRPVRPEDGATELVTPTGAAIVAGLARPEPVPEMRIEAVGYGAGDRTLADRPNVLRILVGEAVVSVGADDVVVLEATIDDMSPQLYEHVLDRLLEAGARDAFLVPVVMKKSRPGTMLRVLAAPPDRDRLAAILFAETTTIGLRWTTWHRSAAARERWSRRRGRRASRSRARPTGRGRGARVRGLPPPRPSAAALAVHQAALAAATRG
jgi:uncharacterized protein (DUF111 family)